MSQEQIYLLLAALILVIAIMAVVVFWQQTRIKTLEEPKIGFLGKPLAGMVATLVIGAGMIGGVYLVNQDNASIDTSAQLNINIEYEKELVADNGSTATYTFTAMPSISDADFSLTGNEKFDVYWNFAGPQNDAQSEIGVSENNPSGITVTLKKGTYDLIILVNYRDTQDDRLYSETLKETIVI